MTPQGLRWMCYIICILDPKMAPIQSNRIAQLEHMPKKLASAFTFGVCGPLNIHSSVAPIMPLAQPAYENMRSYSGDINQKKKDFSGLWKSFTKIKPPWLKNIQYKE